MNASTLPPHFQRLGRRIGIVKSAILRDRNCVHLFPAVLALTWAADCAHSCEIVREKFDASVKELRSDGRLIVTSAGQDVALLLYDYDLPKKGDIGFAALRKALSVATSTPIACEVQKKYANDTYAVCLVEGRVSLAVVFEQWGIAGAKDTSSDPH